VTGQADPDPEREQLARLRKGRTDGLHSARAGQYFGPAEVPPVKAAELVRPTPILERDHDLSPDEPPGRVVPAHAPVYLYGTVQPVN
jgi:hypothetical protein